jgi:hypothetical protein
MPAGPPLTLRGVDLCTSMSRRLHPIWRRNSQSGVRGGARQRNGARLPTRPPPFCVVVNPAAAPERHRPSLLRPRRRTRPRVNLIRLIVHHSPLARKPSACEVSQSTVLCGSGRLDLLEKIQSGRHPPIDRDRRDHHIKTCIKGFDQPRKRKGRSCNRLRHGRAEGAGVFARRACDAGLSCCWR